MWAYLGRVRFFLGQQRRAQEMPEGLPPGGIEEVFRVRVCTENLTLIDYVTESQVP